MSISQIISFALMFLFYSVYRHFMLFNEQYRTTTTQVENKNQLEIMHQVNIQSVVQLFAIQQQLLSDYGLEYEGTIVRCAAFMPAKHRNACGWPDTGVIEYCHSHHTLAIPNDK